MGLREAIKNENKWTETWNGADALNTAGNALIDMFGLAGSMRDSSLSDKEVMIGKAYRENPDYAMKLLFFTRDVRGGYGERDTFRDMVRYLADNHTESVVKNLWAFIEFGRAKDLYFLVGTKAENDMWKFMKSQFEIDYSNMKSGKGVSLLAKWIATPDASSAKTAELGKLTAKKLGYDFKTMRVYKNKLRELRKYIDIPEAKMATGMWSEIEYSKCSSKFLFKYREAIARHDSDGWQSYIDSVNKGKQKINTGTLTPCEIIHKVANNDYDESLETMWKNLPDMCEKNAMVICDTSGSMCSGSGAIKPIDVSIGLAMYIAERNKGDLKDMFMTFSSRPKFVELNGDNLYSNYKIAYNADWGGSTNLKAAFELLLNTCVKNNIKADEMPNAIVVVSDMQINPYIEKEYKDGKLTFYSSMKKRYVDKGYEIPHVVYWNVNAANPTFHASANDNGVSLVSGYSQNIYKQVMESIGMNPIELMYKVLNSDRYADVVA